ncbi:MAG: signal peptidase I, partial [Bacteroidota bacterium]
LYLGFNKQDSYVGKWVEIAPTRKETEKKSATREWLDAVLFAGTAALIIRTFMIEAFMIPTTSMEGSLLAGDFLFVSKFHYGVRLPQAPISFPFVHNTLPFTSSTKSYLDWVVLPYARIPGIKDVERNEIVVFNYPDDDRNPDVPALGEIHVTSMKQNYIKRCVAVAGDSMEIRDRVLYINGAPAWKPPEMQHSYNVKLPNNNAQQLAMKLQKEFGFRYNRGTKRTGPDPNNNIRMTGYVNLIEAHMSESKVKELQEKLPSITITPIIHNWAFYSPDRKDAAAGRANFKQKQMLNIQRAAIPINEYQMMPGDPKNATFPKHPSTDLWTIDNFGPIFIPKAGVTTPLNKQNIWLYEKIISVYEGHELKYGSDGSNITIDGKPASEYTFEMDYYWMMGDNRHASLDSRYWGYVPEDHIIGRPWFVLFSWEGGPRMDRFLRPISGWEP